MAMIKTIEECQSYLESIDKLVYKGKIHTWYDENF